GVDRGAGHAAHLENLAAIGDVLDQPVGPQHTQPLLIDVDIDSVLGVEDVVEGDEDHAGRLRALDHRPERFRVLRVDDDRVIAGIDEVVDRGDLRGDILAGRHDLELLQLRGDIRLGRIGLGRLDHLDAPGIGYEAVRQRDPVWAGLGRVFEELGLFTPRHVALRIAGRAGHDLRPGGPGGGVEEEGGPMRCTGGRAKGQTWRAVQLIVLPGKQYFWAAFALRKPGRHFSHGRFTLQVAGTFRQSWILSYNSGRIHCQRPGAMPGLDCRP